MGSVGSKQENKDLSRKFIMIGVQDIDRMFIQLSSKLEMLNNVRLGIINEK